MVASTSGVLNRIGPTKAWLFAAKVCSWVELKFDFVEQLGGRPIDSSLRHSVLTGDDRYVDVRGMPTWFDDIILLE